MLSESGWRNTDDPKAMLEVVTSRGVSDRKLRLLACALRRQTLGLKWTGVSRGWADIESRPEATVIRNGVGPERPARDLVYLFMRTRPDEDHKPEPRDACAVIRNIVGDPFRPVRLPKSRIRCPECINERWPGWNGSNSLADASGIELAERCCKSCNPVWDKPSPTAGWIDGACPWITPRVRDLADNAYWLRGNQCPVSFSHPAHDDCDGSASGSRREDGRLDPFRLSLLADALEEEGFAETSDETVPRMYVCEKCGHVNDLNDQAGIYCRKCGSDHCRKSRKRDLPHPIIAHLRMKETTEHSDACGTVYRGCAPYCPKDVWELNGPHYRGSWALDLIRGEE